MVFDEIHYMRDPGEGGGGRRNWVIWSGEKWGFTSTLSLNPSPRRERCGMGGDHHPVLALKPVSNRLTFKPVWPNHIH